MIKHTIALFAAFAAAAFCSIPNVVCAQAKFDAKAYEELAPADSTASIAPGTKITLQNWQQYRRFMPVGMQALFTGKYSWKIGPGPEYTMGVGPTVHIPLSRKYLADTEKYSGKVRLRKVSSGGYTVEDYVAGIPFPNPTEPQMGIKLMYDVWFPYSPYLFEVLFISTTVDSFGNAATTTSDTAIWRLNHISDEGKPRSMYSPGYLEADRFEPGFPFSKLITNLVKSCKAPDRRGFGCDRSGAEVARRWVRRKNSPFSSRSTALCGLISKARG